MSAGGGRAFRSAAAIAIGSALLALCARTFLVDHVRVTSGSMAPTLLAGDHLLVWRAAYGARLPFAARLAVAWAAPRRGDVVVFESPREAGRVLVKRVVGVPGDEVELREQVLYVNGVPQRREPVGEETYAERDEATGARVAETCRRYRETLARGALARPPPEGEGAPDPGAAEASFLEAAGVGAAIYDVLQCRRPRLAAREGPWEVVRPGHVFVLGDNRDLSADGRSGGGWQLPEGHILGRAVRILWSRAVASDAFGGEGGGGPGLRRERLFKAVDSRY